MITAIHYLLYSADPTADRQFLRDVIGLPYVDAHDGWLIFALPPAELGVHPIEPATAGRRPPVTDSWSPQHAAFLMCDDLEATMGELEGKGAVFVGAVSEDEGVGRFATIALPGGGRLGLYQPWHASPLPGLATSEPPRTT